jgi:integrase
MPESRTKRKRDRAPLGAYLVSPRDSGRRYYQIRWSDGRGSGRKSTGTTKRAEAEAILREFLRTLDQRRAGLVEVAEGFRLWLDVKEKGGRPVSPKTLDEYQRLSDRLVDFLTGKRKRVHLVDVVPLDLRAWLRQLAADKPKGGGLSPRGVRKRFYVARMAFEWMRRNRLIPENPLDGLEDEVTREKATPVGRLSEEDYQAIVETLEKQIRTKEGPPARPGGRPPKTGKPTTTKPKRVPRPLNGVEVANLETLRDLLEVMWWSGLRSVHACGLRWVDIDLQAEAGPVWTIRAPENKGGVRTYPIRSNLVPLLRRRRQHLGRGPFPALEAVRSTWQRWKKANGWEGVSFHQLRSAFASRAEESMPRGAALFLSGMTPAAGEGSATSAMLGHTGARMTATYVDWRIERLRELLEAM